MDLKKTNGYSDDRDEELIQRMSEVDAHWSRQYNQIEEDLKFATGDQWSQQARNARTGKPVLTLNFTQNYIDRVVNPIRKHPFGINVKHNDKQMSHLYQGIIRDIEYKSNASEAYEAAFENAVAAGLGFICVDTDYEDNTSLNQTINMVRISDPTTVFIDPNSDAIDGSDMDFAMRVKYVDKRKAEKQYDLENDGEHLANYNALFRGWTVPENTLPEMIYYNKEYEKFTRTWLNNGEFFDEDPDMPIPEEMVAGSREIERAYVTVCKYIGGKKVNETRLDTEYIPVITVYGNKICEDNWKGWGGIVKLVKDPQTMINYYASAEAQIVQSAPVSPWLIAEGQVNGYEEIWATANTDMHDHLPYNPTTLNGQTVAPPSRVDNTAQTQHLTAARMGAIEDLQRSTGIFDSQMGREDISGQSGRAIMLKQNNAEISSFHYTDNLMKSITQCGRVVLQLINSLYDTNRKLNVRAENGEVVPIEGNVKEMGAPAESFDAEVEAGPMVQNEKEMSNAMLMEIGQLMPDKFGMIADLLIENTQTKGTEEAVERLRKMLPPELLPEDENAEAPDPQAMAALQEAEATIQEQKTTMDQYEMIVEQLQTMLIDSEKDRQNKVDIEEIKSQTELAKTEMNNEAKITVEELKTGAKIESDIARIAADAERQIRDLVAKSNQETNQQISEVANINPVQAEDALSMVEKTAGPVGGELEEAAALDTEAEGAIESIDHLLEEG